jgi:hypothetical protein
VGVLAAEDAATAIKPIEFEYYPKAVTDCDASSLSAVMIQEKDKCYNLGHPAKSFHIGGPTTQRQVPKGCKITGYASKACEGSINLQITGKSKATECYIVGVNMGNRPPIKSVRLTC